MGSSYPAFAADFIERELAQVALEPAALPFPRAEYASRLQRLRAALSDAGVDVAILMAPDAMGWLHGFSCRVYDWHPPTSGAATTATVVHAHEDPMFFVDTALHSDLIAKTSCVEDLRPLPDTGMSASATAVDFIRFVIEQLRAEGWMSAVVGLERWSGVPNPGVARLFEDALRAAGYTVVDASVPIRSVRRRKSPRELTMIERAQTAVDAGLRELQREARRDMTELEAWQVYMSGVIAAGGEPSAIHETVAAGPMEAFGHALSSQRVLGTASHFTADASAAVERYHARGSRPFTFGEPPAELARLAAICAGAFDVVVETAEVGMPYSELNHALQRYYRSEGVADDVAFGGGYELGVSFMPDFVGEFLWGTDDVETDAVIEAGEVTNFESCAYLALIDTLVFEPGGARFLSTAPREVLVVDP